MQIHISAVVRTRVANRFPLMDEDVGSADDADGATRLVDDGRGAEASIRQHLEGFVDGGIPADGHRIGRHKSFGPQLLQRPGQAFGTYKSFS